MHFNNTSGVPTIRPVYGKQLINLRSMAPPATDGHGWTAVHGKIQPLWFSGPLMPSCTALEDCRLPSDDDNTDDEESDSEADLAFDEYTVSESESDNE